MLCANCKLVCRTIHRYSVMKLEKTPREAQTWSRKLQGTVERGQCHVLCGLLACELQGQLETKAWSVSQSDEFLARVSEMPQSPESKFQGMRVRLPCRVAAPWRPWSRARRPRGRCQKRRARTGANRAPAAVEVSDSWNLASTNLQ